MRTILVTGAAGFIGSNFVHMLLSRGEDVKLIALDKLTYAGNLANLRDVMSDPRLVFAHGDILDKPAVSSLFDQHQITEVVHFAAESHVDRSIMDSGPFVQTNVVGTQVLLDVARSKDVQKYLQVSTDEVRLVGVPINAPPPPVWFLTGVESLNPSKLLLQRWAESGGQPEGRPSSKWTGQVLLSTSSGSAGARIYLYPVNGTSADVAGRKLRLTISREDGETYTSVIRVSQPHFIEGAPETWPRAWSNSLQDGPRL